MDFDNKIVRDLNHLFLFTKMSTSSSSSTTAPTKPTHSLFSLGNLMTTVMDFIEEIKQEIEALKSGTSRVDVLEQSVQFLAAEVTRLITGEPNPLVPPPSLTTPPSQ
jgi:hypothetical protein